jgi:hypothetical protein
MVAASGHSFNVGPYGKNAKQNSLKPTFLPSLVQICFVVSEKKEENVKFP